MENDEAICRISQRKRTFPVEQKEIGSLSILLVRRSNFLPLIVIGLESLLDMHTSAYRRLYFYF